MKKYMAYCLGTFVGGALLAPYTFANATLSDAFQKSVVKVNFRLRYEDVSWDGLEDSDAFTLRSRFSYHSGAYAGFAFTAELDDVRELDDVDYRTAANDPSNPGTAIIADPEGTEVNQALVTYDNFDTQFKYGRQRITLDNQRFIGAVGWRQNEQTYDAFSIANKGLADAQLFYAYITNVNRVFGEDNRIGDHDQETHLLNANYAGWGAGKISAYAYLIDNSDAPALSSETYGLRWMGRFNPTFGYNLEYAAQSEGGDNPVDYSADYVLAEGLITLGKMTTTLGYEVLGSDGGVVGFATPLATLHAFQGWTDRFLDTPANGIEDIYVSLAANLASVQLIAAYHELSSDVSGTDYGSEWDISASKKWGSVVYTAKYADYSADNFGSDTTKFWLMADVNF